MILEIVGRGVRMAKVHPTFTCEIHSQENRFGRWNGHHEL
jgi:hypothetical protein